MGVGMICVQRVLLLFVIASFRCRLINPLLVMPVVDGVSCVVKRIVFAAEFIRAPMTC